MDECLTLKTKCLCRIQLKNKKSASTAIPADCEISLSHRKNEKSF